MTTKMEKEFLNKNEMETKN